MFEVDCLRNTLANIRVDVDDCLSDIKEVNSDSLMYISNKLDNIIRECEEAKIRVNNIWDIVEE